MIFLIDPLNPDFITLRRVLRQVFYMESLPPSSRLDAADVRVFASAVPRSDRPPYAIDPVSALGSESGPNHVLCKLVIPPVNHGKRKQAEPTVLNAWSPIAVVSSNPLAS